VLITNANVITWGDRNEILQGQALHLSGGLVAALGPSADLEAQHHNEPRVDARGQYVMPGNICAHGHFYSALAVGMSVPYDPPISLPTILERLWWPYDRALREEEVRLAAEVGMVDCIKNGTTTYFDHHSSPNCVDGVLDVIADVVDRAGLRSVLCFEVTDRNGDTRARAGIAENARFVERCHSEMVAEGRVAANFGIHAPMTVSDDTLAECRESVSDDTGFHLHVGEHEYDQIRSTALSGKRSVDRLHQHGMLGEKSIMAHAIHLDAKEVLLLAETGTASSHQARNNMNVGDGIAAIESQLRAGVRVCLGNDGLSPTMWREAEVAYFLQKIAHRDGRRFPGDQLLEVAFRNNAALASLYYPQAPLGVIERGAVADLIMVDYQPATPMTPENIAGHLVFAMNESMITTTIVNGEVLMQDRQLLTVDESEIKARCREAAPAFWARYEDAVPDGPILG